MQTIRVQRANVILDICPDEKENYKDKGFSVVDYETGEVIEKAIPADVNTLKTNIKDLEDQLINKDEEIKKLEAEIKKLKSKPAQK